MLSGLLRLDLTRLRRVMSSGGDAVSQFIPRGFQALCELRDELGQEEIRLQLAAGEQKAYRYNSRSGQLQPVATREWLKEDADRLIANGYRQSYHSWDREVLLVAVKPKPAQ